MKNVYFVPKFPIDKLATLSEEGWVHQPYHIRNQYRYLEAIVEDITNSFCEPILVTQSEDYWQAGAHGVNRLVAIVRHTDWTHIPAILNAPSVPDFITDAILITNLDELAVHFKRDLKDPNIADVTFGDNGVNIGSWNSFQPLQIMKTFMASPETKERILELFAIEQIENRTLKTENLDPIQLEKWQQAHSRWKNGQTSF